MATTLDGGPTRVTDLEMTGPRGGTCIEPKGVIDQSGSMAGFAAERDAALAELLRWLPGQLRADDVPLEVIDFAVNAQLRARADVPTPVVDGMSTLLTPALEASAAARRNPRCDLVIMVLSDAQLADLPATDEAGRALLNRFDIHDLILLVPGEDVAVPEQWTTAFPAATPQRFDGTDADDTALTLAQAVADVTGQTLTEVDH